MDPNFSQDGGSYGPFTTRNTREIPITGPVTNPYNPHQSYSVPYDDHSLAPTGRVASKYLYYQIASLPNSDNKGLYHVRKFIFQESLERFHQKDYWLDKNQVQTLMRKKPTHQYKCYSVYDLNSVKVPTTGELMVASSQMMSESFDYSGFAPF